MKLFLALLTFTSAVAAHTFDESPLMIACRMGNIKEMQTLIAQGADVNFNYAVDFPKAGWTALSYAISNHSIEQVSLLLNAGANVDSFTISTLMDRAKPGYGLVRNLAPLSHAIRVKAPLPILEMLVAHGANIDGQPMIFGEWSSLMVAAYVDYPEAVEYLLAHGADKHLINGDKTALDYAQELDHKEIIELLSRESA